MSRDFDEQSLARDARIEEWLLAMPDDLDLDEMESVLHAIIASHLEDVDHVPNFCFYFALKTKALWADMEERESSTTH